MIGRKLVDSREWIGDRLKSFLFCILLFITIHCTLFTIHCFANDLSFEATVDKKKASIGSSVELDLTFYGAQNVNALQLSGIDGFQWRYLGPSSRVSIVNGQASAAITHIYTLLPLKKGIFKLGPFTVDYNGKKYTSGEIEIEVLDAPVSDTRDEEQKPQESLDLKDRVFLIMEAKKNKAYLNEPVDLSIKLYVNKLSVKCDQPPSFSHDGFSIGEYVSEPAQYQEVLGGINYNVAEFKTKIFATRAGELKLGPAEIQCNLIVQKNRQRKGGNSPFDDSDSFFDSDMFNSMFSGYESYLLNLKSVEIPFIVEALPDIDKPVDFSGAVGDFSFEVKVEPIEVKVGDPITIQMTISGKGNLQTVNCPELFQEDGFKVYAPQVKTEGSSKIFEQIIMPKTEDIKEVPEIKFSFFNPETEKYQVVSKGPFPIKVSKAEQEEAVVKAVEHGEGVTRFVPQEALGRDIIYIKDSLGVLNKKGVYLYNDRRFLILLFLPLLIFIFVFLFYQRDKKLKSDIRYARKLKASQGVHKGIRQIEHLLNKDNAQVFYNAVFKIMQDYLGNKFHLSSQAITSSVIDEILKPSGIDEQIISKVNDIFKDCDMARFAPSQIDNSKMQETFGKLQEVVEYFEKTGNRGKGIGDRFKGFLFCTLLFITIHYPLFTIPCFADSENTSPNYSFYKANSAYEKADYDQAIAEYDRIILQNWESGNIYYNIGNCYFKKGQLGKAILYYSKARRLMPRDSDLKSNYEYVLSKTEIDAGGVNKTWFSRFKGVLLENMGVNEIVIMAFVLYLILVLFLIVSFYAPEIRQHRTTVGIALLILLLLTIGLLVDNVRSSFGQAIVVTKKIEVKFEPFQRATNYFELKEGMQVKVFESNSNRWSKVKRPDGKIGWVESKDLEII